jgi:hypothetical protein
MRWVGGIIAFETTTERDIYTGQRSGVGDGAICTVEDTTGAWVYRNSTWNPVGSGSGGYTATTVGQVLYSQDGSTFAAEDPITSTAGWLVNNDGLLLIL